MKFYMSEEQLSTLIDGVSQPFGTEHNP